MELKEKKILFFKKNDQMKVGDKVYVVVSTEQINKLLSVFGHDEKLAQKILNNRWRTIWTSFS